MLWDPLREVIEALGTWRPTEDQYQIGWADTARRGRATPTLDKADEAGLLNGILYASLLPDRADLDPGDVPFLVPVFVPLRYRRTRVAGAEVLALSVAVDGVPLDDLDGLPVLRAGATERQEVTLAIASSRGKRLEDGTLTLSVGFGAGPSPVVTWPAADGTVERLVLDPGVRLPTGAPSWVRYVQVRTDLAPLSQRDLSLCYGVTSDLAGRATARLLAQFRPMVAGRMRYHSLANEENIRHGGTACTDDDRRNDLYECLLLHVRSYVAKALREDGSYDRDLFAYVSGCFKPAAARVMLGYGPRTGHQDQTGESAKVSELVGSLRQHAAIYRLTDPEMARAHHAVHWVLARRLHDRLASGELAMDDLWAMWDRGDLPRGVTIPDAAAWDTAIGHQVTHVPLDPSSDDDNEALADVIPLPGAATATRTTPLLLEPELDLLTEPTEVTGFFAITSRVAAQLAAEEPEVWAEAVGQGRAVNRLLRTVMEPFADGVTPRQAAARLYDSCTVGTSWRTGNDLITAWQRGAPPADAGGDESA
jgi:hypothetical protein